jgi:hypothetical protein
LTKIKRRAEMTDTEFRVIMEKELERAMEGCVNADVSFTVFKDSGEIVKYQVIKTVFLKTKEAEGNHEDTGEGV